MASIEIEGVQKAYGKTLAVRGVDLSIASGEFVVILGPSGCGKSTLLRMIAGLEDITAGTAAIDGEIVNDTEPGQRGCAMVFQNYALYPHLTVAQNIGYALKVAGVPRADRDERVTAVATSLGLQELLQRKPGQLSGGQRQRVAMGRAMIRKPRVFLFDEPLSNLDAKLRLHMRLEIKRLHRDLGATSIFVTHDQAEAMTLADRLVVMNGGRIEQQGHPSEVYNRPSSRFVADFLGSPPMNFVDGRVGADGRLEGDAARLLAEPPRFALPAGSPVTLGVRPFSLELCAAGAPGAVGFSAEMHEDLGSEMHIHGEAAGIRLTAAAPSGALPDGALFIRVPVTEAHFFTANDGQRVEPIVNLPLPTANGASQWNAKQPSFT